MSRGIGKIQRAMLAYLETDPHGRSDIGIQRLTPIVELAIHIYGITPHPDCFVHAICPEDCAERHWRVRYLSGPHAGWGKWSSGHPGRWPTFRADEHWDPKCVCEIPASALVATRRAARRLRDAGLVMTATTRDGGVRLMPTDEQMTAWEAGIEAGMAKLMNIYPGRK